VGRLGAPHTPFLPSRFGFRCPPDRGRFGDQARVTLGTLRHNDAGPSLRGDAPLGAMVGRKGPKKSAATFTSTSRNGSGAGKTLLTRNSVQSRRYGIGPVILCTGATTAVRLPAGRFAQFLDPSRALHNLMRYMLCHRRCALTRDRLGCRFTTKRVLRSSRVSRQPRANPEQGGSCLDMSPPRRSRETPITASRRPAVDNRRSALRGLYSQSPRPRYTAIPHKVQGAQTSRRRVVQTLAARAALRQTSKRQAISGEADAKSNITNKGVGQCDVSTSYLAEPSL
jgi:hypothetical protein